MTKVRLYDALTTKDLSRLRDIGLQEHENFFRRNPRLKFPYYRRLLAICLCQGAASHYLDNRWGINDFDLWHFYLEHASVPFPYRAHYRIQNGYRGRRVDFLKRTIREDIALRHCDSGEAVLAYLLERNTSSKRLLVRKGVIGLFPSRIFGKVLWKGEG